VLINLISNAVKFTEKGTVAVSVTAGETSADGRREFCFTVTDTGIGIPEDRRGILFQSFNQVDPSHSRSYGGAGLGLAISKELVTLMGGTITCESRENVGSAFSFTIPLGETEAESNPILTSDEPDSPDTEAAATEGEHLPRRLTRTT
jgi:signal transduction histidine kinase